MAIFKKNDKKVTSVKKEEVSAPRDARLVIPRITEKATYMAEKNVYVFNVDSGATKGSVRNSIKAQYKVNPVRINIVNQIGKKIVTKGRVGRSKNIKKAYVYLKDGDKIELV